MSSNSTKNGVEIIPINEHILVTAVGRGENAGENFVDFYESVEAARKMWAADTRRGDYRLELSTLKGLQETDLDYLRRATYKCPEGTKLHTEDGHILVSKDGNGVKLQTIPSLTRKETCEELNVAESSRNQPPEGVEVLPLKEYVLIGAIGRGEERGNKFVGIYENLEEAEESWKEDIECGYCKVRPVKLYEVVKQDLIETACMCQDGTILKAVDGHIIVHVKWCDDEANVKLEKVSNQPKK